MRDKRIIITQTKDSFNVDYLYKESWESEWKLLDNIDQVNRFFDGDIGFTHLFKQVSREIVSKHVKHKLDKKKKRDS